MREYRIIYKYNGQIRSCNISQIIREDLVILLKTWTLGQIHRVMSRSFNESPPWTTDEYDILNEAGLVWKSWMED